MSVLQGGKFGHGFASAGFTKAATPLVLSFDNILAEGVASAVVGGTASELTGGKFANGAQNAAFLYAFNALTSRIKDNSITPERQEKIDKMRAENREENGLWKSFKGWLKTFYSHESLQTAGQAFSKPLTVCGVASKHCSVAGKVLDVVLVTDEVLNKHPDAALQNIAPMVAEQVTKTMMHRLGGMSELGANVIGASMSLGTSTAIEIEGINEHDTVWTNIDE